MVMYEYLVTKYLIMLNCVRERCLCRCRRHCWDELSTNCRIHLEFAINLLSAELICRGIEIRNDMLEQTFAVICSGIGNFRGIGNFSRIGNCSDMQWDRSFQRDRGFQRDSNLRDMQREMSFQRDRDMQYSGIGIFSGIGTYNDMHQEKNTTL